MKIFALFIPVFLSALPSSMQVVEGQGTLTISPNALEIQVNDRSILEWNDFSINSHETVNFSQPNAESIVLNRVVGPNSSQLFGKLLSNGKLILINPLGVLVGKHAQIDMGSFIASTLDLQNDLFVKNGELSFSGTSLASVKNQGSIRAKNDVCLIGAVVENQGSIVAQNGLVGLVAQGDVVLKSSGIDRLFIKGHVLNDSENLFAQAFLACDQLAKIGYVAHSGSITADWVGLSGGIVDVQTSSVIDASGLHGGGIVLIGGDYQGKNSSFPNAKITSVNTGAEIRADALESGNGGKIIIWGDLASQMAGSLSAQGGPLGGDGGFLEVSSPGALNFLGTVNTNALQGQGGSLLLDPAGVTIAGATVNWNPICPTGFIGNPAVVQISNAALIGALGACNVTIDTSTSSGGGTGDITVVLPFAWASANSLSLTANQDIIVNPGANIIAGVASIGGISLTAVRNITVRANIQNTAPTGGALSPVSLIAGGSITIGANAQSQSITVGSTNGPVTISACQDVIVRSSFTGVANLFTVIGQADGNSNGDILVSAGRNFSMFGGGNNIFCYSAITRLGGGPVTAPAGVDGNITVNVTNDLLLVGGNTFVTESYIGHGGFTFPILAIRRWGDITVNVGHNLTLQGGTSPFFLPGYAFIGSDTFTNAVNDLRSIVRVNVGNDCTLGAFPTFASFSYIGGGLTANSNGYRQTIFINVGGNLNLDGRQGFSSLNLFNDNGVAAFPPLLSVRVGGNFVSLGGTNPASTGSVIGYHQPSNVSPFLTELFVAGSIVSLHGQTSTGSLHVSGSPGVYNFGTFDARAGGDVIDSDPGPAFPTTYRTFGSISYQADYAFAAGQLWTLATVPPVFVCGSNIFAGTPLGTTSGAVPSDGLGGVQFDLNYYDTFLFSYATLTAPIFSGPVVNLGYISDTGDLTFISSDRLATTGGPANVTFGGNTGETFLLAPVGNIIADGFNDININAMFTFPPSAAIEATVGTVFVLANHNITLTSGQVIAGQTVTFVVDEAFPNRPLIGTGAFNMDAGSEVISGTNLVGIYTALQSQNIIDPLALFNGIDIATIFSNAGLTFGSTTLFLNTPLEIWCTYFSQGIPPTTPLTIFYKNCLAQAVQQAQVIISEFLVDLHPYNEYPGWSQDFRMSMVAQPNQGDSFYVDWNWVINFDLWRRHLSLFNQPRYWTLILHNGRMKGDE